MCGPILSLIFFFLPRSFGVQSSAHHFANGCILSDCSSPVTQFRATVNKLRIFSSKLSLDENWLIYRFHTNLGFEYNSYFERYAQDHDPFNEMGESKHTLSQAKQHFQNTVTNPSKSNDKTVTAKAAASNAQTQAGAQPGTAHSRIITKTIKYCNHCRKDYHVERASVMKNIHTSLTKTHGVSPISVVGVPKVKVKVKSQPEIMTQPKEPSAPTWPPRI